LTSNRAQILASVLSAVAAVLILVTALLNLELGSKAIGVLVFWGSWILGLAALLCLAVLLARLQRSTSSMKWWGIFVLAVFLLAVVVCAPVKRGMIRSASRTERTKDFIIAIADLRAHTEEYRFNAASETELLLSAVVELTATHEGIVIERIRAADHEIENSEVARAIGTERLADLVIWGHYTGSRTGALVSVRMETLSERPAWDIGGLERHSISYEVSNVLEYANTGRTRSVRALMSLFLGELNFDTDQFETCIAWITEGLVLGDGLTPPDWLHEARYVRGLAYLILGLAAPAEADLQYVMEQGYDFAALHCAYGLALQLQGQHGNAYDVFSKACELSPSNALAHVCLGMSCLALDRQGEAQDAFDASWGVAQDVMSLALLYAVQAHQGDMAGALLGLLETISSNPDNSNLHEMIGNLFLATGDNDRAVEHYEIAAEIDPKSMSPRLNLIFAYLASGELDEALKQATKIVKDDPSSAKGQLMMARIQGKKGDFQIALVHAENALKLDPSLVEAHVARGSALMNLGYAREAISEFSEAIGFNPELWAALALRGKVKLMIAQSQDDSLAALEDLEAALKLAGDTSFLSSDYRPRILPSNSSPYSVSYYLSTRGAPDISQLHLWIAQANNSLGKTDVALEELRIAESLSSRSDLVYGSILYEKATSYFLSRRYAEAERAYSESQNYTQHERNSKLGIGLCSMLSGHAEQAIAEIGEVVRLYGDSGAEEHVWLAASLREAGRFPEGLTSLQEAVRKNPGFAMVHYEIARFAMALGNYGEALLECDLAEQLGYPITDILQMRAGVLHSLGRSNEERQVLRDLLNLIDDEGLRGTVQERIESISSEHEE